MKVVVISTEYPNPAEPLKGIFVSARLREVAKLAEIRVISPVGVFDYGSPSRRWQGGRGIPAFAREQNIRVDFPRWFYPPFGGVINALCLFLRLWPILAGLRKEFPFQMICANFAHPEGIAAALLGWAFRVPVAITMRGNEIFHCRFRFRRWSINWALRRASRVIAVSGALRQLAIRAGAAPEGVKTIPNGIDTAMFYPRDRTQCRAKHNIQPGDKVILLVGYLAPVKGQHLAIEALSGLAQATLLLAGGTGRSGEYGVRVRNQIARAGLEDRVRFLGELSQETLAEHMCAADVLCLSSLREGCPNVVNEALACGTPVVASAVGAVPQMVPSTEFGSVVSVNDVPALRDALRAALAREWDRPRIAAHGAARSWRQVAAEEAVELSQAIAEFRGQAGRPQWALKPGSSESSDR